MVTIGDDILIQGYDDFVPAKVIDVSSQVKEGDHHFVLIFSYMFFVSALIMMFLYFCNYDIAVFIAILFG